MYINNESWTYESLYSSSKAKNESDKKKKIVFKR